MVASIAFSGLPRLPQPTVASKAVRPPRFQRTKKVARVALLLTAIGIGGKAAYAGYQGLGQAAQHYKQVDPNYTRITTLKKPDVLTWIGLGTAGVGTVFTAALSLWRPRSKYPTWPFNFEKSVLR